jgi:hypothetical protein
MALLRRHELYSSVAVLVVLPVYNLEPHWQALSLLLNGRLV